jgi:hypothetical protein
MKKFIFTCTIFIIPIIALFIFPLIIFLKGGEGLPISNIVDVQQESSSSILYMSGLTAINDKYYKLLTSTKKNPEIVVFGTSRTLAFKSNYFKNIESFYNAGYNANASMRTADLLDYINNIPKDSKLHVILFDVSDFLNSQNSASSEIKNNILDSAHLFLTTGWHDIYTDFFKGNITIDKLYSSSSNIGLTAIMHNFGYRNDGSLERGNISVVDKLKIQKDVSSQISEEVSAINSNQINFLDFGKTINQDNLSLIEKFLEICKSRNIYVIGYYPPSAIEIHDTMMSLKNDYGNTYKEVPGIFSSLFKKYDYNFYDARDITSIGSSDSELYDPYHPTERATIKLLIYLANKEPNLKSYLDIFKLKKQIGIEPF